MSANNWVLQSGPQELISFWWAHELDWLTILTHPAGGAYLSAQTAHVGEESAIAAAFVATMAGSAAMNVLSSPPLPASEFGPACVVHDDASLRKWLHSVVASLWLFKYAAVGRAPSLVGNETAPHLLR